MRSRLDELPLQIHVGQYGESINCRFVDEIPTLPTFDIIKTGCQVKIILNMDFGIRTSVSDFNRPFYQSACDI
jgi:hypothetical protein